jgi:beta-galactosidase
MNRCFFAVLVIMFTAGSSFAQKHTFTLNDTAFLLDGRPFLMISGEMHYTRVPREAWRARLRMAKAMGLNTIGTYVFWNVNEPEKGKFDFSGNNDIAAFVRAAQEEGLWVVLRPSPYVCAEWEFGGYPYWLENEAGLVVRSREPKYLEEYRKYIMELGKQLAPLQVGRGGNILMVQIENEYGSYGGDKEYLEANRRLFVEAGFDGMLYTCDPVKDIAKGYLPGLLPAVNGLLTPADIRSVVNRYHGGKGPYYVAEWYPAWFDWWGEPHHTVPVGRYAKELDTLLSNGISINMYMFHGGTTRGFMNGANDYDTSFYQPQTSSYDYDAPLDEAGNPTEKFMKFRAVIQKHLPAGVVLPDVPPAKPVVEVPAVKWVGSALLFGVLPRPVVSDRPKSFEDLGQAYGYVLYRTVMDGGDAGVLRLGGLRDYGIVFVNGKRVGILDRMLKQDSLSLALPPGKVRVDILVENMGRVNFGPNLLKNKKGIVGEVKWKGRVVKGWEMYSLPFSNVEGVVSGGPVSDGAVKDGPVIRKGVFELEEPGDTYLDMSSWGKGCVWVNGHHLGRYWRKGPQQTIYVPVEWLKKGKNEIVVLELIKPEQTQLSAIGKPVLDQLSK